MTGGVSFLDRHRNTLLTIATVAGVAALIWIDSQRGRLPDGAPAPDVQLAVLGQKDPVALQQLRGQPAVLDFWATWCGPCRKSLPDIDVLAAKYDGRARFFAVNSQNEEVALQEEFRLSLGLRLPIVTEGAQAAALFNVELLPTTVVLDRDGKVVRTFTGAVNPSAIAHVLDDLL